MMTQKVQRQQSRHSDESVVAVDIETTGLDPSKDAIISIAAVKSIPMVKQVSLTD
jgi:CRISPR-associated protein Cas2